MQYSCFRFVAQLLLSIFVSFCNIASMQTSWNTSASRLAVMLFSLLWLSVRKPPFLQVRACSMIKFLPYAHAYSFWDNGHPYLMLTRSQNFCLLRMYPLFSIGWMVNHVEAPCSVLVPFSLHCWPFSLDLILTSFCWLYS